MLGASFMVSFIAMGQDDAGHLLVAFSFRANRSNRRYNAQNHSEILA